MDIIFHEHHRYRWISSPVGQTWLLVARTCTSMVDPPPGSCMVIPDFRTPDNIRLGMASIYKGYMDSYTGMQRIREVVESEEYLKKT